MDKRKRACKQALLKQEVALVPSCQALVPNRRRKRLVWVLALDR